MLVKLRHFQTRPRSRGSCRHKMVAKDSLLGRRARGDLRRTSGRQASGHRTRLVFLVSHHQHAWRLLPRGLSRPVHHKSWLCLWLLAISGQVPLLIAIVATPLSEFHLRFPAIGSRVSFPATIRAFHRTRRSLTLSAHPSAGSLRASASRLIAAPPLDRRKAAGFVERVDLLRRHEGQHVRLQLEDLVVGTV